MLTHTLLACALALSLSTQGTPRSSTPTAPAPRSSSGPSSATVRASTVTTISGVDRALFHIRTSEGQGSGFQYRTAGYVLTNRHVVSASPVGSAVTLRPVRTSQDGSVGLGEPIEGTVRFKHPELDVAVIEIPPSRTASCLMPVSTEGGKHVARGVELYAHGFPSTTGPAVTPTISRGLLSAHYEDAVTGQTFYLTDTALSPGSSGGPVTDARGAVVGIATAVSIVRDGAGTSWGYVLPIRSVEQALKCQNGLAALPKPFSAAAHVKAIAASATADRAVAAYRKGIEDAVKQCASAVELGLAVEELAKALRSNKGTLPKERYKAYNDATLGAATALIGRLFEFGLAGEDESVQEVFARALHSGSVDEWALAVMTRTFEPMSEHDRMVAFAELLAEHAAGLSAMLKLADRDCTEIRKAMSAMESDTPSDRRTIRTLSKSLATLIVTRMNLSMIEPSQIDPDDRKLPLQVRQRLRTCRASLQNCVDEWSALSDECRRVADGMLEDFAATAQGGGRARGERAGGDDVRGGGEDELSAVLPVWREAGFTVWGEVQRGRTEGTSHGFRVDFDESPAIVWCGVRSPMGKGFTLAVKDEDGNQVYQLGSIRQGDVIWHGVEITKDGSLSATFDSDGMRNYPYEFVLVHRESPLVKARPALRAVLPGSVEVACQSLILNPGASDEYKFDARKWSSFIVLATDVRGSDIDMEILDASGRQVAADTDEDSLPIVMVNGADRASYTVRYRNAGRETVILDSIVFGKAR
jgi:hypothetical protein